MFSISTSKVRFVSAVALLGALSACRGNGGDLLWTPAPPPSASAPAPSPLREMLVPDPSAAPTAGAAQPSAGQLDRVHVAHVLIAHTDSIMRAPTITRNVDQARQFATQIAQRARGGEDFRGLARANSDEPGHEGKGGDLGFITRGQTVEPFERAAFALAVDGISDVVQTQFGFHVIKRLE